MFFALSGASLPVHEGGSAAYRSNALTTRGTLTITRRLVGGQAKMLTLFAMLGGASFIVTRRVVESQTFLFVHALVAVLLAVAAANKLVRRLRITVDDAVRGQIKAFRVEGAQAFGSAEVVRLFCEEEAIEVGQLAVDDGPMTPHHRTVHHLYAQMRDGSANRLVGSIDVPEVALYLRTIIEEHLGLATKG